MHRYRILIATLLSLTFYTSCSDPSGAVITDVTAAYFAWQGLNASDYTFEMAQALDGRARSQFVKLHVQRETGVVEMTPASVEHFAVLTIGDLWINIHSWRAAGLLTSASFTSEGIPVEVVIRDPERTMSSRYWLRNFSLTK